MRPALASAAGGSIRSNRKQVILAACLNPLWPEEIQEHLEVMQQWAGLEGGNGLVSEALLQGAVELVLLVAAIELISPGNKDRAAERLAFAVKCAMPPEAAHAILTLERGQLIRPSADIAGAGIVSGCWPTPYIRSKKLSLPRCFAYFLTRPASRAGPSR